MFICFDINQCINFGIYGLYIWLLLQSCAVETARAVRAKALSEWVETEEKNATYLKRIVILSSYERQMWKIAANELWW